MALVLDLGNTPLADRMPTAEQLKESEPVSPLQLAFCDECTLVQILETVPPEILFCDDYPYFSSVTETLLTHSRANVEDMLVRKSLNSESLVIELASNDGYLLQYYNQHGIPVLGVDPAEGPAKKAIEIGIPTDITFFTQDYAEHLVSEGRQADVVHANNVLAHVEDTNGFVAGLAAILKPDGVGVIEHPYVRDLVEKNQFDTIYHEHLCYFSVTALDALYRRNGLFLQDIKRLSIHGGSLRSYVGKADTPSESVSRLLKEERDLGIDKLEYYSAFSSRVQHVCKALNELISTLRSEGKSVAAYGAAAKGSTLINVAHISKDLVEFVVDRNVHKQGRHMPGQHQPILSPDELLARMPDYTLLLPWNFADEILEQQSEYRQKGGKFIVPIPEPTII